ncbi:MAG TPA: hypothetical protein VG369_08395 [Humibacter sp.]|jgi:cell division protein FtsL|nr:hypothetical protein [Humibacter sp.]
MSQATAPIASVLPARRSPSEKRTSHLEALPRVSRRARPKLFYASLAVLTVMVVVVTQLLLSIGVSQGAYRIESLQSTKASLARQYQQASENVQVLSSPQNLASKAAALGMVNNGTPVYLRLSDGVVIGSPAAASAAGAASGSELVANALNSELQSGKGSSSSTKTSGTGSAATDSTTPTTNEAKPDNTPVPWTGALPAPSTH